MARARSISATSAVVQAPRARHDVAGRARADRLLERQEVSDQIRQPFRRIDVVRHDHRRPRCRRRLTWRVAQIVQQVGAQVDRPLREGGPSVGMAAIAAAYRRRDDRPHPPGNDPIIDRQAGAGGRNVRECAAFAQARDIVGRYRRRLRRDLEIAVRCERALPAIPLEKRRREAHPQAARPRTPGAGCRPTPPEPRAAGRLRRSPQLEIRTEQRRQTAVRLRVARGQFSADALVESRRLFHRRIDDAKAGRRRRDEA